MLPEFQIASPCSASWEEMSGDNRARHCSQCNLDVYNFSEMTSTEIESLIAASAGQRLCGRLYKRADGTMLTQDCPVGLRARIRRVSRRLTTALAAAMSLVFTAQIFSQQSTSQQSTPMQGRVIMGDVVLPAQTGLNLAVVDPSGAAVPKAQVFLLDRKTGKSTAQGMTDQSGNFNLANVTAGDYTITVQASGFVGGSKPVSVKNHQMQSITMGLHPTTMRAGGFTTGIIAVQAIKPAPVNLPEK